MSCCSGENYTDHDLTLEDYEVTCYNEQCPGDAEVILSEVSTVCGHCHRGCEGHGEFEWTCPSCNETTTELFSGVC